MTGEAIGVIEVGSIGKGIQATDGLLKQAGVSLVLARPICPGKYLSIFKGTVADVQDGVATGSRLAGDQLIDQLVLPNPHPGVLEGLLQVSTTSTVEAMGIVETFSAATCLEAADVAAKQAEVSLVEVRLSIMMAGKNYLTLTGDESAVAEAVATAAAVIREKGLLLSAVVIPRPQEELIQHLL